MRINMNCQICGGGHTMAEHYDENEYDEYADYENMGADDSSNDYDTSSDEIIEYAQVDVQPSQTTPPMQSSIPEGQNMAPPQQSVTQTKEPTAAIVQDLARIAAAAQSGDKNQMIDAMENFSLSQLSRFRNLTVVGGLLVMWAYRGKLSAIERAMMGLIGTGILVSYGRNYLQNKKLTESQAMAQFNQDFLTDKKLSGRY